MLPCKFSAFQSAAIKACDTLGDGVVDGVIGDPLACTFDPNSLVGTSTPCGTITAQDAAVVAKIVNGTRATSGDFLWYGPRGALRSPGKFWAPVWGTRQPPVAQESARHSRS